MKCLQHLVRKQFVVAKVQHRINVLDIVFTEYVVLFCECRFHSFGRCSHSWAGVAAGQLDQGRMQDIVHGEENCVERLLAVLLLNQVIDV